MLPAMSLNKKMSLNKLIGWEPYFIMFSQLIFQRQTEAIKSSGKCVSSISEI